MESSPSDEARWRQLMAVHGELEQSMVTLPKLVGRDFRPREASPRTVRFAQALALDVAWSGISEARARRAARVH
jgi:hypothetical protein